MMKKTVTIQILFATIFVSILSANDAFISFYKDALHTLSYEQNYNLQKKSRQFAIKAKEINKYLQLHATLSYADTDAKLLEHHYRTMDISIINTIDIFSKNINDIELLKLKTKEDKFLTQIKKEKLFLKLLDMITNYNLSEEKNAKMRILYKSQQSFIKELKSAVKIGAISELKLTQFENSTILLKVQVDNEKSILNLIKMQLKLYSKKPIPHLSIDKVDSDLKRFLFFSPSLKLNDNHAIQSLQQVKKLKQNWLPDAIMGINKEYNNDPTANGDNYTFGLGLQLKYDGENSYNLQKQKVKTVQIKAMKKELKIQRTIQYVTWENQYQIAKKSFYTLKKALNKTKKTLYSARNAYLKNYMDLNSYVQLMQENLKIIDVEISSKYNMIKNATILNLLTNGIIYK